jgi:hypothetical protein
VINGMNGVDKVTVFIRQNDTSVFLVGTFKIWLQSRRSKIRTLRTSAWQNDPKHDDIIMNDAA